MLSHVWVCCRVLAEKDPEKRAEMMKSIDMRRGASLSRQSAAMSEEVSLFVSCHLFAAMPYLSALQSRIMRNSNKPMQGPAQVS